jgi:2-polyprenyl-6-methoxyphenol hydroxylase-like FAD-dependent oxidoreductase
LSKTLHTQVLIVGAGPTGLMAANQLMRFGIDFIIIDHKSGPTKESRAIVLTAKSLELYQQMGLSDHILKHGTYIHSFNLFSEGKRKAEIKLGEIGKGQSEFSYLVAFEQSKNEELLTQQLVKNGKSPLWEHEFIKLLEYTKEISALVKNKDGELTITAQYLIGCDGAKSPVRHQLNFSFKGGTYDHKFFVADVVLDWKLGYDKLLISPGKRDFVGFIPLYGDRSYRVLGTMPLEYADKEDITFADIEDTIKKILQYPVKFEKVNWFSMYKLHHRGVDHFKQGKVFLAGDSAHIHSPAGGQGMNTGLQDAYNLCWKLAFVLKKQAKEDLLETYNEERLPFAKFLLNFTDRAFSFITNSNWFTRLFRKFVALNVAGFIVSRPFVRRRAFRTVSQIGYSLKDFSLSGSNTAQKLSFHAGDRLPYIENFPDGKFYELFTDPGFHLLSIGATLTKDQKAHFTFPVKYIQTPLSDDWRKFGVTSPLFILIRPDNYMMYVSDTFDPAQLKAHLSKYFNV